MKRLLLIIGLCWLTGTVAVADTVAPETLLDIRDNTLTGTTRQVTYSGTPAVLIEPPPESTVVVNPAESLPPPDLRQNMLQIPIKTPFGHEQTAAFLNHTTDFSLIVQVLDEETLLVEEQIQFVSTQDKTRFRRVLSKQISDNNNRTTTQIQPLTLSRDSARVRFDTEETDTAITLTYPNDLTAGVHWFTLRYLVQGAIRTDTSVADLFLSLTGGDWPLMTERFSLIVLFPKKGAVYTKELLFGTNNQPVPDMFTVRTDPTGALVYQLKHPLPAFADVRLHLTFDKAVLFPAEESHLSERMMIFLIYCLILMGYVGLSVWTAVRKKWKNPLTRARRLNPLLWRVGTGKPYGAQEQKELRTLLYRDDRKIRWKKYLAKPIILRCLSFLRFNFEYIVGITILIALTQTMAEKYQVELSGAVHNGLVLIGWLALFAIDRYGTQKELTNLKNQLKKELLDTPQGLNLAQRDILSYYLIAMCLGFGSDWRTRLVQNNPTYQSFFAKENL